MGQYTIPYEVGPEMFLHINVGLSENQQAQLLKVLKKNKEHLYGNTLI